MKKILLLGSGELGKEFVISAQRKGQHIIACDSYAGAPAMQVADECEVFDMLNGEELERVVKKHQPDIIVPEIEAIRTERLYDFEKEGIQVVPSARAVNFTMNRKAIRDLAAKEFIKFDSEITLLTVTQKNGPTLFCPPIGHVQKGGDYRESFQPAHIDPAHLKEAEEMAEKVTRALTGAGLWGVEFFLSHENGVYFSELSPRPHDTGMVTLAGTQNLNEFELHLRAVLGLPIPGIKQERIGASAVILSPIASQERPQYRGMEEVTKEEDTYLRIFGKPFTRVNRRMGVVLCYAPLDSDLDALRDKAKRIAEKVEVY